MEMRWAVTTQAKEPGILNESILSGRAELISDFEKELAKKILRK